MVRTFRSVLSLLFLALIMGVIAVGCANDTGTTQTNGMKEGVVRGTLTGKVMRGPMCPAQPKDTPCPPEPASGVKLLVLTPTGEEIKSVVTDDQGAYSISLTPGTYRIEMAPLTGIEFTKDLPTIVTIVERKETLLDVHIDTGIR